MNLLEKIKGIFKKSEKKPDVLDITSVSIYGLSEDKRVPCGIGLNCVSFSDTQCLVWHKEKRLLGIPYRFDKFEIVAFNGNAKLFSSRIVLTKMTKVLNSDSRVLDLVETYGELVVYLLDYTTLETTSFEPSKVI